ncbi:MAG: AMP-binding protein [Pirellulales bacterium]|nr:AMP-binding protein [Pirellulales bacterium]
MTREEKTSETDKAVIELLDLVQTLAVELHPRQVRTGSIGLDDTLHGDIGIDSLGRVELISRIEKSFSVSLPEDIFATAETPRDLLAAIARASGQKLEFTPPRINDLPLEAVTPVDEAAQTLIDVLDWHARRNPDRPHIRFYQDDGNGEVITYGQLLERATAVARGLQQRDLQPGQAVALMLPTSDDYFYSFYGALLAGGVPVPIYPPMRPAQLEDHLRRQGSILKNCRAAVLITVPEAKRLAHLLSSQVESLKAVVTVDELNRADGDFVRLTPAADDLAFIQYTSGSTGNPKGVMLSHANLLANIRADGQAIRADSNDVFVSWLPLYHDMGLIGAWLGSLYFAPQLVIMSPLAFLTRPQRWLWAIHQHRGTLSAAPNFAYELCLNKIDDADLEGLDLGSWRIALNGAETVNPESVQGFCDRFGQYGFRRETMFPVYGLAECTVGLSFPPLERGPRIDRVLREPFQQDGKAIPSEHSEEQTLQFVACGYPLPGHEVRIVDDAGRELPDRRRGRLQFRGPSTTRGYFDNPEATRKLRHGDWLDSGDLAYITEGAIYITGRSKALSIRAGRNLFPDEIDGAISEVEGIRKGRVAVFASDDPKSATERLVVLAETREQDPAARQALIANINQVATDLTQGPPDDVLLAPPDTVLKTSSGKIRRAACRELYETDQIGKRRLPVWWQLARLWFAGLTPRLRRLRHQCFAALFAGYSWLVFGVLAGLVFPGVMIAPTAASRWTVLHRGARLFVRACGVPLTVEGLDNLPPPEQPCIIVANHASYIDAFVMLAAVPKPFSFLAKAELGSNPAVRLFLKRIGTELIERFDIEQGVVGARHAMQAARQGRSLMVFAEGTFTRVPGLMPFYLGGFVTAVDAELPVVPVAIRGTRSMLRPDEWFPHRGRIGVCIGQAIEADPNLPDRWARVLRLRDATRAFILEHCGEPDLVHERLLL